MGSQIETSSHDISGGCDGIRIAQLSSEVAINVLFTLETGVRPLSVRSRPLSKTSVRLGWVDSCR